MPTSIQSQEFVHVCTLIMHADAKGLRGCPFCTGWDGQNLRSKYLPYQLINHVFNSNSTIKTSYFVATQQVAQPLTSSLVTMRRTLAERFHATVLDPRPWEHRCETTGIHAGVFSKMMLLDHLGVVTNPHMLFCERGMITVVLQRHPSIQPFATIGL